MIRAATPDDARAIATVGVTTWRHAYAGLLPEDTLAGLSVETGAANWRDWLAAPAGGVAVALDGTEVIGFACHGPQRDGSLRDQGFDAEVMALYVLPSAQGRGTGRRLLSWSMRALREGGHAGLAIWTLRDNRPARAFYERLGGTAVAEKADAVAGHPVLDVAYAWPSLASSLSAITSTASATMGVGSRQ